ncbi:hypothetical protein ACFZAE_37890, partial [Streptomyces scabiei]|uniref:hypothetical protein n=1 Tax=Streptomyces scabiei TaxID=1930 RepID=UPI0036E38A8C
AGGIKPLMEFLAEFLRPGIRLAANSLWFMSGRWRGPCLAREFAWRQILGCGGFGLCILPGGKIDFVCCLGRWRGLCVGFGWWCGLFAERWCAPVVMVCRCGGVSCLVA